MKKKNKWFIAIKFREANNLFSLDNLQIIDSPDDHYWADPFLLDDEDRTWCFFEDYDYEKGRIAVAEVKEDRGRIYFEQPRIVLDEPQHMSFPSVYYFEGNYYMVPERCLAGSLWIYKAHRFPDIWGMHRLVATGRFDDPILHRTGDGYQVWATEDNKLVVWQAGTLNSEHWRVVKREDRPYMRNAGNFIEAQDNEQNKTVWLRPTQDSIPEYGRAIKILEGDKVVGTIEPKWYPDLTGTHTFNISKKYAVVDGRIKLA